MLSTFKTCRKCGQSKLVSPEFFQAIPNSIDGFRQTCLDCKSKADRERYEVNKEAKIRASSEWYVNNRQRKQEYDRTYREKNRLKIREQKRIAWNARREKLPLLRLTQNVYMRGRSFDRDKRFDIRLADIRRIIHRQNQQCFYCSDVMNDQTGIEFDHVIPRHRGGNHSIGNLVAACLSCNREKAHRLITEYRLKKVVLR